ncbi:uroporphyrinogen-III synthase [Synechococcus elongatus]|uniref:Uroporphyrinogen-III synthase n=2 Tax=Synechococcus elongatus TaxID=32046 RepID=HEM4_SYNE7|nr:uroporphyrinogen-III synthase [Synechococcus elongatus]P42452.1 RecName: Full=Uroporphyrinogen-III synthase; Short=UROS; AltName: Full=Hydroxymethylbilane hydrolyase [cyclizing]; AltName: Full=Uroporphyrinogen-III cosynthase [Synechococcus elongatus PCC 7942 = FACHB-805]pir/S42534/ uroporphyrinogen III synthase - Synechococcus sp [Synechococcus sp.]ABB56304.1 uroporphyrinogen-III synthase [Synechococcus elongatus PCC 7942 = FACHB-805]AJD56647.1 uroporphyrinogen-III synthase [Synechococcus el
MAEQPLIGKTILTTRAAGQSSPFAAQLRAAGAAVIEMPTLEIGPPSSWLPLDEAIAAIADFDWLILASANAVEAVQQRLAAQQKSWSDVPCAIAVVGQKTAQVLAAQGGKADYIPPEFIAESLVEHFPQPVAGQRLLFPRVETGGREQITQALQSQGAIVVEVPAYESRCPSQIPDDALIALRQAHLNLISFTSSKTVRNFCQLMASNLGVDWSARISGVAIASIGPQTSITCQELLGRVEVEAQEYTLDGLLLAIEQWARQTT